MEARLACKGTVEGSSSILDLWYLQMRTLTIKMEEIESTMISTSRVTIQKMETRIEELETLYTREKTMHVETMSALHKKDR